MKKAFPALALALIGAIFSAMLTTSYKNLRENGESYTPALRAGLNTLWDAGVAIALSPWVLIPLGAAILVAVTVAVTVRVTRPKRDPLRAIGARMGQFARAAQHDQNYRRFSSIYHDTMRICHEFEAFIVEVQQHGLDIPSPQSNDATEWIDICGDYFMAVGAHLRSGNIAHALGAAKGFAQRYPPRGN